MLCDKNRGLTALSGAADDWEGVKSFPTDPVPKIAPPPAHGEGRYPLDTPKPRGASSSDYMGRLSHQQA